MRLEGGAFEPPSAPLMVQSLRLYHFFALTNWYGHSENTKAREQSEEL